MTKDRLLARTRKELAQLARKRGIAGWHDMSKVELVKALAETPKPAIKPTKTAVGSNGTVSGRTISMIKSRIQAADSRNHHAERDGNSGVKSRRQTAAAHTTNGEEETPEFKAERSKYDVGVPTKDLTTRLPRDMPNGYGKDRIVVMVRDPYWLHCYWELTRISVERAEAALGQDWHGAKAILRVQDVTAEDSSSAAEAAVRDIEIHGGCNNWYIDIQRPHRSIRVDIGYITKNGRFYGLARSNVVRTPRAGVSDTIDENWTDVQQNYEKIYAMSGGYDPGVSSVELKQLFEERLRRPMGSPSVTSFGSGVLGKIHPRRFFFELDAELIVYGKTEPNARVTLQGEPVQLRPDGTFTMRYSLPDNRQIIPAVSASADGIEERTIVLAVERNTKALDPLIHEQHES